jgi:hypothetical protein
MQAIMTYTVNPIGRILKGFNNFFYRLGKARAAAELHRMGYHEEAKRLMLSDD